MTTIRIYFQISVLRTLVERANMGVLAATQGRRVHLRLAATGWFDRYIHALSLHYFTATLRVQMQLSHPTQTIIIVQCIYRHWSDQNYVQLIVKSNYILNTSLIIKTELSDLPSRKFMSSLILE
jgi:hypothetical protein